ncbi:MAG: radical SAM protein, partial [Myxococcales bacterium]|nr:radical SAM protein [Myxococcales bacterium]
MGESARVELQVGHLCNNRCVFCISGHLTHLRQAPLIADELLKQQIDGAYANGARHLTFLGGEPTIQPGFVELVRYAAKRGFEQIVVFSNGSRLHRGDLLERLLDTGAHFEFRFSFQGGNAEAHERTTRRKGSFAQLVSSLDAVRAQQQAATVNMCVVRQNFESVTDFPALLVPRGVTHLHLDMIHPDDTPDPRPAALADVIPRYGEVARALRAMASSMPDDFRFNIGNLPFCIAPELAPHIHHGGQPTQTATAAVSGEPGLNEAWNKYEHKQKNKLKLPSCAECQFDVRCSGIFPQYAELYGTEELVPVRTPGAAATQSFEASLADCLSQLPRCRLQMVTDGQGASRLLARLGGSEVWLDPGGTGHAISDRFSLSLRRGAFADAKLVWDALL